MNKKPLIELIQLSKSFEDEVAVVKDMNLTIYENEFITLLGPSGCGKSTTLRMIGGFEKPTDGHIVIDGKIVNDLPPYARPINTVFQRYALFPHLNVIENVSFSLNNRNKAFLIKFFDLDAQAKDLSKQIKAAIKKAAMDALALVKLIGYENRKITQLSGGQQQRVALARALINKPEILLLDEPLAALDLKLRQNMQYELKEMQRKLGITFIFVTHDQEEAMTMSDRIAVMKDGVIQQLGTPKHIYNEPVNRYVANFIGESNIFDGIFINTDRVSFLNTEWACTGYQFNDHENVDVVIRPEDWDIVKPELGKLKGIVTSAIFKGVHYEYTVRINDQLVDINDYETYQVGDEIGIKIDPYEIHLMKKDLGNG